MAYPNYLTQCEDEISLDYIRNEVVLPALKLGIILVAENSSGEIVGSYKGYTSPYRSLTHIMDNMTLAVLPNSSGKKAFVSLFDAFFEEIKNNHRYVYRVIMAPHETNNVAINCYIRHGCRVEYTSEGAVNKSLECQLENATNLVWFNPNFDRNKLEERYLYLKEYLKTNINTFGKLHAIV